MIYTEVLLGDLITTKGGGTPSKKVKEYWDGHIPWASVKDLTGIYLSKTQDYITEEGLKNSASNLIPEGNIILATRMVVGKACINTFPVAINQDLRALFCSDRILPNYLLWFLLSSSHILERQASGATVKGITLDAISNLQIPLPPLEEQKRIAAILDKADRIRRKRQEAIRLTEELGRSIFLDMFGDPVTNPKGWEVASLSKFGEVLTGNTPPRADLDNYGNCIEWIKSDNITTPYHFLTEASEKLSSTGKKKGRVVPPGSILVCCIAGSKSSIGRAAIADREVAFNQQINAVVPNKSVDTYFLYSQFLVSQNLVQSESTDSMKGLVNKSKFSGIQFLKPPLSKQIEFRENFLKFIDIYKCLTASLAESENLFNSLLQRAFRGEL